MKEVELFDELLDEFKRGISYKWEELSRQLQYLSALNKFTIDNESVRQFQVQNQLEASRIFNEEWFMNVEGISECLSFFVCKDQDYRNDELGEDFLKKVLLEFICDVNNKVIVQLDEKDLEFVPELIQDMAKSPHWRKFILFQWLATRTYFNSFILELIKDPISKPPGVVALTKNFGPKITSDQLKVIHGNLVDNEIIRDTVSQEDFVNVFTKDWGTHSSKVYFMVPNNLIKTTLQYLKEHFSKNLSYASASRSGHIINKYGNPVNAASLSSYDSNRETPYEQEMLIKNCIKV